MSDLQRVGPVFGGTGTAPPFTSDITGAQRTADAHGRYTDAATRQQIFFAASQAATTWSVALTATYTGLVISNPPNSGRNLAMLQAGFALSVAPAGIASVGFIAGWAATGVTAHTTPLVPLSSYLNQDTATGVAKADGAATIVGTPRWVGQFLGGFTAAALFATSPSVIDLGGIYIVPPGSYFGIGALTAVVGFASLVWEELPILQ